MNKQLLKDSVLWGIIIWLFGYLLGILLFPLVPTAYIGWVIMPIGILVTLWVLFYKVKVKTFREFIILGVSWAIIAVILDYLLLVQLFKPTDGYYKLDVYLYYLITLLLPIGVGYLKRKNN